MTLDEFEYLLSLHGPDMSRWPDGQQKTAEKLAQSEPKVQTLLTEAAALEPMIYAAMKPEYAAGQVAAALQSRFYDRQERCWISFLWSPKGILTLGSFGSAGGIAVALAVPVVVDSSALLLLAIGGAMP